MELRAEGERDGLRFLSRLPFALVRPLPLLLMASGIHVAGRIAAILNPNKWDSLAYAVSADLTWRSGTPYYSLILDKPPGQALLTGWIFRILPGPHSRLLLIPVELLFMVGAYVVFWLLARRCFGRQTAAALTLLLILAFNAYSALDTTTDGLALNENHLALPMWLAVWAHLVVRRPFWRGLLCGLGLGTALSIKQTAVALAAVMALHEVLRNRKSKAWAGARIAWLTTIGVILAIGGAVLVFLAWRGWVGEYLPGLIRLSGRRVGSVQWRWPESYKLVPLAAMGWWVLLGLLAARGRTPPAVESSAEQVPTGLLSFACLWFVAEAILLGLLQIPSTHYYQQIVAPAALLAGIGLTAINRRLAELPLRPRWKAHRWIAATTAGLALLTLMPLLAAAAKLAPTFDPQAEVREYDRLMADWSKRADVPIEERRP